MKVPEPRKLSSGTWFLQMRLNGVSVPVTAATRKECVDKAALIKAEHRAGKRTIQSSGASTLSRAIDKYIEARKNVLSPSTIDGYKRIQKNRFKTVMNLPLSSVSNWQAIVNKEAGECAPKTLRNAWRFVCSVLSENGISAPKVTLPAPNGKVREWLEPDQIKKLIREADGTPSAIPVFLALHSLRRSEILALTWDDIDLERKCITVSGSVVQDEHHHYVHRDSNKTEKSKRTVPIMIPELLVLLASTPQDERHGPFVKIKPHAIADRINAACRRAGLPEVGTHGLRHSFASLAYHLGMSALETMELGGWSDTGTMHNIYTHLAQADRLKAENKLTEFFAN